MFPFGLILVLVLSAVVIVMWSLNLRFRRRELKPCERLAAFEKGTPLTFPEASEKRQWDPGATQAQINQYLAERPEDGMPNALALIGLIPMGVCAAYLILYRTEIRSAPAREITTVETAG